MAARRHKIDHSVYRVSANGFRMSIPRALLFFLLSAVTGGGASFAYHRIEPSDHDQLVRISQKLDDLADRVSELSTEIAELRKQKDN